MTYLSALCSKLNPVYNNLGVLVGYSIVDIIEESDQYPLNSDFIWVDFTATVYPDIELYSGYVALDETTLIRPSLVYFSTVDNQIYLQTNYAIGQSIPISSGFPISNVTTEAPPFSYEYENSTLYYYNGSWVISSFDPSLSLAEAKLSVKKNLINPQAYNQLVSTDWYSIRQLENATPIPVEYLNWRQTIRDEANAKVSTVNALTTTAELNTYCEGINIDVWTSPPNVLPFNVTNNGSGNYVIDGESNPLLTLTRGITYTFNIAAPSHPFWIKTTQTIGTNDQYNTGVTNNGEDNGVITFTVTDSAPDTLYYNCQYHASMQGVISIIG